MSDMIMHRFPVAKLAKAFLQAKTATDPFARDVATRLGNNKRGKPLMAAMMTDAKSPVHAAVKDTLDYSPLNHVVLVDGFSTARAIKGVTEAGEMARLAGPTADYHREAAAVALVLLVGAEQLIFRSARKHERS